MSNSAVVRQYIVDTTGKQIGVILPIEEYQALVRLQNNPRAGHVAKPNGARTALRRAAPPGRRGRVHGGDR